MPEPIQAILLDIEGTTTPIAFVHDTLFPFARGKLASLLATRADDPAVAAELTTIRDMAPGQDPLAVLLGWMAADAKHTPLKTLQGLIWEQGYAAGELRGAMYPDVAPALRRWHTAGLRLFVYSSGSEAAQRLIFGHSTDGDLAGLFDGFFDTRVGAKRDAASYAAIASRTGIAPGATLFLSDVGPELDAARTAGMQTCQLVRPQDGTEPAEDHPHAGDFEEIKKRVLF